MGKSGYIFRFYNYTDSNEEFEAVQTFPSGNYRSLIRIYGDDDDCIYDLDVRLTVKSGGSYEFQDPMLKQINIIGVDNYFLGVVFGCKYLSVNILLLWIWCVKR